MDGLPKPDPIEEIDELQEEENSVSAPKPRY